MKTEKELEPRYAVYDMIDKLWIGDINGPIVYSDFDLAQVVAVIVTEQTDEKVGRFVVRPFFEGYFKGAADLPINRTAEDAIRNLEKEGLKKL